MDRLDLKMYNPRRARSRLVVPTQAIDTRMKTSWFQPTMETVREADHILANMFFLVRQGDTFGERIRCTRCNQRHNYITLMCVNRPITGIVQGLYAYYRAIKDTGRDKELTPDEQTRFDMVFDALMQMPDLSNVHPQMARQVVKDIGPKDAQLGAIALGVLEPISPTEARQLAEKINMYGIRPPFVLEEPKQHEVDRMMEYKAPSKYSRSRW